MDAPLYTLLSCAEFFRKSKFSFPFSQQMVQTVIWKPFVLPKNAINFFYPSWSISYIKYIVFFQWLLQDRFNTHLLWCFIFDQGRKQVEMEGRMERFNPNLSLHSSCMQHHYDKSCSVRKKHRCRTLIIQHHHCWQRSILCTAVSGYYIPLTHLLPKLLIV